MTQSGMSLREHPFNKGENMVECILTWDDQQKVYQYGYAHLDHYLAQKEGRSSWIPAQLHIITEALLLGIDATLLTFKEYPRIAFQLFALLRELNTAYNYEKAKFSECTEPAFIQIETAVLELINTQGYLNGRDLLWFKQTLLPIFQLCGRFLLGIMPQLEQLNKRSILKNYCIQPHQDKELTEIISEHLTAAIAALEKTPAYQQDKERKYTLQEVVDKKIPPISPLIASTTSKPYLKRKRTSSNQENESKIESNDYRTKLRSSTTQQPFIAQKESPKASAAYKKSR